MKILLALSAPLGSASGAASYAFNFKRELEKKGLAVKVVSYQKLAKLPQPFKLLAYFLKLLKAARQVDLIYSFNLISAGLPAGLVSFFLRKNLVLRIGGDFLWERAFEQGRTTKTLREYYTQPKVLKEKWQIFLSNYVLKRAVKVVFSTNFQRQLYLKHYKLTEEKTAVIDNPFLEVDFSSFKFPRTRASSARGRQVSSFTILYAGRFLKLKNLAMLIDVFAQVLQTTEKPLTLKLIGQGPEISNLKLQIKNLPVRQAGKKLEDKIIIQPPLSQDDLWQEIAKSWLCVLPSITDISPNFALEALALEKPLLLTKETGLHQRFQDDLIFIDPQSPVDIEQKILFLLQAQNYQNYLAEIKQIDKAYSWPQVAEKHLEFFKIK